MRKKIVEVILFAILCFPTFAQGNWEVSAHYSSWSINVAKDYIEENFVDAFEYYDPTKGALNFDSNGNNMGLMVRFYPGGKEGAFSLGVSYERNNFKGTLTGSYVETDNHGNRAEVTANGLFDLTPHSFNFSIRWDLFPSGAVHPYIGVGVGFGPLNGILSLETVTRTTINGSTITDREYEELTLEEAIEKLEIEEGENYPFNFFPILHVCVGLKGEILPNIYLMGEAAFYDGIIFRGGVAVRL